MDVMNRDAGHRIHHMTRILEFAAQINYFFSTIKQRKLNSSIFIFGVAPRVADQMSGVSSATLDNPLAPPLATMCHGSAAQNMHSHKCDHVNFFYSHTLNFGRSLEPCHWISSKIYLFVF